MKTKRTRLIVEIKDGLITIVHSDQPIELTVVDWDLIETGLKMPIEIGDHQTHIAVHNDDGDCIDDVFSKIKQKANDVLVNA